MKDLSSILLTIFGILLFIFFLPTLLWIILIVVAIVVCYIAYQKHKYTKYMNDFMENAEEEYRYNEKQSYSQDDNVIDVEFSESDEDES